MMSFQVKIKCLFAIAAMLTIAGCEEKEKGPSGPPNFVFNCDSSELAANDTNASNIHLEVRDGYIGSLEVTATNGVLLYKGRPAQRHILNAKDFVGTQFASGILKIRANRIPDSNVLLVLKAREGIVGSEVINFYKPNAVPVSKRPLFINGSFSVTVDSLQSITEPFIELTLAVDTSLRDSSVTFTTSNNASFNPTGSVLVTSLVRTIAVDGKLKIKLYVYSAQSSGAADVSVYLTNAPSYRFDATFSLYSLPRLLGLNAPSLTASGNPVVANGTNFAIINFRSIPQLAGQRITFTASDGKFLFSNTNTYQPNLNNTGAATAYFVPDSGATGVSVIQVKYYDDIYQASVNVVKIQ